MCYQYKVSVIVPVYNVEMYLERCLESLVNQTIDSIEVIVVNDGTKDNSQDIIDRYEKMYPDIIKSYIKENGGLSDARNYGLKFAKGEYIGFVDSDDYVEVSMYEKMYEKAMESEADIVTCGYYGVDESAKQTKKLQSGNMQHFDKNIFENPKLLYINSPYAWNKIYKHELFLKTNIKYPKGLLFEDISTTYPLFLHANKISKVDEFLYYYILKREGSITGTYSPKMIQLIDSLERLNEYYKKNSYFISFKKELQFINLKHIYNRLFEFSEFTHNEFKKEFIDRAFKHLDNYFPDWQNFDFFYNWVIGKSKIKKKLYKSRKYWALNTVIPSSFSKKIKKCYKFSKSFKKKFLNMDLHKKFIYAYYYKHRKVKENIVLFESFHGTTISDSPYYLMKEIIKDKKFKVYFTTNKYKIHKEYLKENNIPVKLVKLNSFKYQKLIATSEFLVNNVSFPEHFIRRTEQKVLNTWHGTPLKTLGKNMKKGIESMHNIQHNFLQSTLLLFPNEFTKEVTMRDYNLEKNYTGKTVINGYPRNSIFNNQEKAKKLREELKITNNTVYAYMPTWRGVNSINVDKKSYCQEMKELLQTIDTRLKDNQLMYVNLHPILKNNISFKEFRHIHEFPKNIDNYEFLNCVDALITDYSSVFFDFSITKKPIILFMYDYEEYLADRGMYLNIKSLPFKQIFEQEEFIDALVNEDFMQYSYDDEIYRRKFISYDSNRTSSELAEMFFYGKEENHMIIEDYKFNSLKESVNICYLDFITNKNQLLKICDKYNLEDTVFVFQTNKFSENLNLLLFEEFNDKINYLVINKIHILTYVEKIMYAFRKGNFENYMLQQELKRILPNIKINKIYREN